MTGLRYDPALDRVPVPRWVVLQWLAWYEAAVPSGYAPSNALEAVKQALADRREVQKVWP